MIVMIQQTLSKLSGKFLVLICSAPKNARSKRVAQVEESDEEMADEDVNPDASVMDFDEEDSPIVKKVKKAVVKKEPVPTSKSKGKQKTLKSFLKEDNSEGGSSRSTRTR
jgi:hypothetical protein